MSEPDAASTQADLAALRALEEDASDLQRIVTLLDCFNVFERTAGFDKNEVMHSNLLASLLDPKRTGVLGERLTRELLRETLDAGRETVPPSAFGGLGRVLENLDGMDFGNTLVRREYEFIDVLLTNEDHRLAVIIENKVWASEGPGQLDWYDRIIRHTHPGWDVHRIFLSPSGFAPSHEAYVFLSYGALCDIVDRVAEGEDSAIDPDMRVPAQHYARMVRRRILGDSEVVRLAQELYEKHERAINLIYKHRPNVDVRAQIKEMIVSLVKDEPGLTLDKTQKGDIRFAVREWDKPALLIPEGFPREWTPSGRMLLFQVTNGQKVLNLNLFMGPGPEETRQKLLVMVRNNEPDVFIMPRAIGTWIPIYQRPILLPEVYDKLTREQREQEIRRHWDEFLAKDLPRIEEALRREAWIWESEELDEERSSEGSRFVWGEGDIVITKRPEDED